MELVRGKGRFLRGMAQGRTIQVLKKTCQNTDEIRTEKALDGNGGTISATCVNRCQISLSNPDVINGGLPCWYGCSLAYFQPCKPALILRFKRREMKNRMSVTEVSEKLGYPSSETIEGLRLLKAFVKLSPSQRSEVIDILEELTTGPTPFPGGINGRFSTR